MSNLIEAGIEQETSFSTILSSKALEASLLMEKLHPNKLEDIRNLELMLRSYDRGELNIRYKKHGFKVEKGFKVGLITVSLAPNNEGPIRLNFHTRIWSDDPQRDTQNISKGKSVDLNNTGMILQINTVKDSINQFVQKSGVDFRKYPGRRPFPVQSMIYKTPKPERYSLRMEISTEELLAMQREVLRLYGRPECSPALQR